MSRRLVAAVLVLPALGGCASTEPPAVAEDPVLARDRRLARLSFEQQRPEQAASLYAQALDRARERDDLEVIAILGYELAIAQLRTGDAGAALATVRTTRAEVVRRGSAPRPELLLVEAVARYRTGDGPGARDLADVVVAMPDAGDDIRARATFVQGLVAADAGDAPALADAVARLPVVDGPVAADRDELAGRLAMLQGDPAAARSALLRAADRRRERIDYRGMARALALAADAAGSDGRDGEAADLWLRAGRSAQLAGDREDAGRWLSAARRLGETAGAPDVVAEADARLAELSVAGRGGSR